MHLDEIKAYHEAKEHLMRHEGTHPANRKHESHEKHESKYEEAMEKGQ